jgi:hypothetical protein
LHLARHARTTVWEKYSATYTDRILGRLGWINQEGTLTAAQKNLAALHDLAVFEPWFLLQGLLLLFAGRWFARTATGRRWWTLSSIAGTVQAVAFGVTLAVAHKRFAVS